jgi:hypothetical protein
MSDLEERARRLVDAARPGHNPTAADAARVRAALKARVLAEPLLIQPGPTQAGPLRAEGAPGAAGGALGKVLVALGMGSALGFAAGLYAARAFWPDTRAQPVEARPLAQGSTGEAAGASNVRLDGGKAAVTKDTPSVSQGATPSVEGPPFVPPRAPPRASANTARASSVPAVSPIKAELDGLRRAQEQLYQGRPAWAIARLDELDRAGVGSVLLEERAATRAIAECRLGVAGAPASDEYARRFPRSAHLEQVRASCSGAPHGGAATPGGGTPARKVAPTLTESRGSQHEE